MAEINTGNNVESARLTVRNFRAIDFADISLNGITVIAGINGSGKSTISKLFYYILRTAAHFDDLALVRFKRRVRKYDDLLERLDYLIQDKYHTNFSRKGLEEVDSFDEAENYVLFVDNWCYYQANLLERYQEETQDENAKRVIQLLRFILGNNNNRSAGELLRMLSDNVRDIYYDCRDKRNDRSYNWLKEVIVGIFNDNDNEPIDRKVNLMEFDAPIFAESLNSVPMLHTIQKVIYVDTPMAIGFDKSRSIPDYWNELNDLLRHKSVYVGRNHSVINKIISNEIINGDVSYDNNGILTQSFWFQMADGRQVELANCATGIRSFAMFQLLLKNGHIDENTLLIIDEPEAHLHPQWIIEYARIIVLIHKEFNAKFLLASHSPDLVSAIKELAEAEGCDNALTYYLSEPSSQQGQYSFKNLQGDIEPIFASFNKSYENLNRYARQEREEM